MIVTLIKKDRIYDTYLPQKIMGQFYVYDIDSNNKKRQLISIEGEEDHWVAKSNKKVQLLDENANPQKESVIEDQSLNILSIKNEQEHSFLYAYDIDYNLLKFQKLVITHDGQITFGREDNNSISYDNPFVSSHHFTLQYQNGHFILFDNNSSNGVYVNEKRVQKSILKAGDIIFVMGFKLIVGSNFIAINNPGDKVKYNNTMLVPMKKQEFKAREIEEEDQEEEFFYRSPRFKREVVTEEIEIDAPPGKQDRESTPALLQYGPILTMATSTALSSIMSINNMMVQGRSFNSVLPTIIIAVVSLLGTLLWPILLRTYMRRKDKKNEKKRQKKYSQYLHDKEIEINNIVKMQTEILMENNITYEECVNRIMNTSPTLFERMSGQNDFLVVNIGIGNLPVDANIKGASRSFQLEDDNLKEMMYKLKERPHTLTSVPITYSLIDNYFTGIIGDRPLVENFTKRLILQLATLHSYDEVKIIYIGAEADFHKWEFIKWLPHIWDNTKTMRYLATNTNEVRTLSSYFEPIVDHLIEKKQTMSPYFVVVVTDRELFAQCDFLKKILNNQANIGFSIITLFDKITNLPKESTSVIDISPNETKTYNKNNISGGVLSFVSDCRECTDLTDLAIKLSNVNLDINEKKYAMPDMITFLEMYGVDKIEHLNVLNRWQNSDPMNTLRAPVGVNSIGELFYLDLHEKFHGPHGLIAGMTGSGKSEFIITYILSLALNYHPDEVSFILIDYKGGGLTGAFENPETGVRLPHISGTITNLSGNQIKRSLVSVESELKRRQAIFNDARNKSGEGTIDIYKYQQLRREGVVKEAVPHLFIISDEFAELKSQQPEFMDELISTARIGRSLGVHLILATQKPSGVVNDQIWSNSKFRVCLKVQTTADSNEMLKRPEAAEITQTGRFYLQVGYNELFELGQSAWAGAPYDPNQNTKDLKDEGVSIINNLGGIIRNQKIEKKDDGKKKEQQVVAIVRHLSDLSKTEHVHSPRLWLDPIPNKIYTEDLEEKYNYQEQDYRLNPIIGEYDQPSNQKQGLLTMPLSKHGNAIVYGSVGSGKTTLLHTVFDSIMRHHSSEEVNMYIIDLGAGTLKYLEKAPHVGDVLTQVDPEKVLNLMKMIKEELETRKRLFSDYGGSYSKYLEKSGNILPNIILAINNYSALSETVDLSLDLASLTRDCYKYGIFVILTASEVGAIRYNLKQNFKLLYTLQLNDQSDYSSVVGRTKGLYPEATPGRGLVNIDEIMEFQTALCSKQEDIFEYMNDFNIKLQEKNKTKAKKAPFLPDYVNVDFIGSEISTLENIPIGVIKENLKIFTQDLTETPISIISAEELQTTVPFIEEYVNVLKQINNNMVTVLDLEDNLKINTSGNCFVVNKDYDKIINAISNEILSRNKIYEQTKDLSKFENIQTSVFIINGLASFVKIIEQETLNLFSKALDTLSEVYKIYFVLVDEESGLKDASVTSWYKNKIGDKEGLWIGSGFDMQSIIKTNKLLTARSLPTAANMGIFVHKGKEHTIKILQDENEIQQ